MSESRKPANTSKSQKKSGCRPYGKRRLVRYIGFFRPFRRLLTIDEVGDWLNVGESTIRELWEDRLLVPVKIRKCLRWVYRDVENYIQSAKA